jgi:HlyD family secretion protein
MKGPDPVKSALSAVRGRITAWTGRNRGLAVGLSVLLVLLAFDVLMRAVLGPKVPVHLVQRRPLAQRVVVTGRVLPPARVQIGSVVTGRVSTVPFDDGAHVQKGMLLVGLEDSTARAAVAQAEAQLEQAVGRYQQMRELVSRLAAERLDQTRARRLQAEDKLRRAQTLFDTGGGTAEQREDAQRALDIARSEQQSAEAQLASASPHGAEYRQAEASLAESRAALEGARARLADTRVLAPADGVLTGRQVEPGDVVQAGRTLLVLIRDGETRLVVEPDEKNLAYLEVGQKALASADAFPDRRFSAAVWRIAPDVDPGRGTIEVQLLVPEPPAYLRPDMTVSVDIEVARRDAALVLPAETTRAAAGREPWVLRLAGGRTERRPVSLGIRGTGTVEITAGLEAGEAVVAPGPGDPGPGKRVRGAPVEAPGAL